MPSSDSEYYDEEPVENDEVMNWRKKAAVKKTPTQEDVSRAAFRKNLMDSASVATKKNFLQKILGDPNKKVKELLQKRLPKGILKHSPSGDASEVRKYKSNSICEDTSDSDVQTERSSISKDNLHNSKNSKSKSNVQVPSESSGFESYTDSNERNVPNKNKSKRILNKSSGDDTNGSSDGNTTDADERKKKKKVLKINKSETSDTESFNYSEEDVPSSGDKNPSKTTPNNSGKSKIAITPRKKEELSSSGSDSERSVEKPKKVTGNKNTSKTSANSGKSKNAITPRKNEELSSSGSDSERNVKKPKKVILLERDKKFTIGSQIRITPLKPEKIVPPSQKLLDAFATENELNKIATKPEWLVDLSPDDEIFSVQIPKSLQVQLLIDNLVPLNGQAKFKIEKDTYVWNAFVDDDLPRVDLIAAVSAGNYAMKAVRPKGAVVVHRQIKVKHRPVELPPMNDTVEVPHDLKLRHPLFGLNYEDKIVLDERVVDKLNNVKRKKKRKHVEDNHDDDSSKMKKKKKRSKDPSNEIDVSREETKHQSIQESANDDNFDIFKLLDDYTLDRNSHKTKKKKKKKERGDEIHNNEESFTSDHKPLFVDDDLSRIINDDPSKRKKKKKRNKDVGEVGDVSRSKDNELDMNDSRKKKKSKKEFLIANSTMMSPACTAYKADDSTREERKEKKRKSKSKEENPDFLNFIDGLVKEVDDITMTAKKKHDNETGISNDSERKRKKKKKHSHRE